VWTAAAEGRSPGKKKQGEEARFKMGKAVKKTSSSKRDVSEVCFADPASS
jgi:hypothetical protein